MVEKTVGKLTIELEAKGDKDLAEIRQELQEMKKLLVSVSGELKDFSKETQETTKDSAKDWALFGDATLGILEKVGKGALAAAGLIADALTLPFEFVNEQTAALDQTAKNARAVGALAEEYQQLQGAAAGANIEQEAFNAGAITLNEQLKAAEDELVGGTVGPVRDLLQQLNLDVESFDGTTITEQFALISDGLENIQDPLERVRLTKVLFGDPQFINFLEGGGENLKNTASAIDEVFTSDQLKQAEDYQSSLGEVNRTIDFLVKTAALELLPVIQELINEFIAWLDQNDALIKQDLPKIVGLIGKAILAVAPAVKDVIDLVLFLVDLFTRLTDSIEGAIGPKVWNTIKSAIFGILNPLSIVRKGIDALTDAVQTLIDEFAVLRELGKKLGIVDDEGQLISLASRRKEAQEAVNEDLGDELVQNVLLDVRNLDNLVQREVLKAEQKNRRNRRRRRADAKEDQEKEFEAVSLNEFIQAGVRGDIQGLNNLAAKTKDAAKIEPNVAITVNNNTNNINVDIQVDGSEDPVAVAQNTARELTREIEDALNKIAGNIAR